MILSLFARDCQASQTQQQPPADRVWDVVVYGGTSAGVAAAVQAARIGKSVVIVSPDVHLGGLTASGLGWTDSGNKTVVGGIAREFYGRIWNHYEKEDAWKWQTREEYGNRGQGGPALDGKSRTMWIFEPHVAEGVFESMVEEAEIPLVRDEWLDREKGVEMENGRIVSITTLSGKTYRGKMFIDATYEGDLMAAARVTYTIGREANDVYGETLNGVQPPGEYHQFDRNVSPYVVPGDPSSGLVPRVHDGDPGKLGQGDKRVQAYCYRVCLTKAPENRVPFPKPEGYDPFQYELLARYLAAGGRGVFRKFDPIPNSKTDTNNHGAMSTDNIGMNYDYPEASYERRREICKEHEAYQKGLFYFLANDAKVPDDVRDEMAQWGLAKDEFLDNGHWPHQIYVREARRMVSDFVMTELHCRRIKPTPRPVGMGSYNMDSHNVQRYVDADGWVRNEGDVQVSPGGPYPIDYLAIVPRRGECENLFVPVCASCSHIAFGSIRMEPVFMILGQSAATAASLAIDANTSVQEVPYETLRERLLADGQVLEYDGPRPAIREGINPKTLAGIVVEAEDAEQIGQWLRSSAVGRYVGTGYLHDNDAKKGVNSIRFEADLPSPGVYEVRFAVSRHSNRARNVPVTVRHAEGQETINVDQTAEPPIGALWMSLGRFPFEQKGVVLLLTTGTNGHVVADAVQFLPMEEK